MKTHWNCMIHIVMIIKVENIIKTGKLDSNYDKNSLEMNNILIDFYSHFGYIQKTENIFYKLEKNNIFDIITIIMNQLQKHWIYIININVIIYVKIMNHFIRWVLSYSKIFYPKIVIEPNRFTETHYIIVCISVRYVKF